MTKYEYLAELEKKLDMLSYEDKNQALEYYESYFEDAGKVLPCRPGAEICTARI